MTDAGEVAVDIGLEYVVHLLGHDLQAQRLPSVAMVAPRPKAVTAVEEPGLNRRPCEHRPLLNGIGIVRTALRKRSSRCRSDKLTADSKAGWQCSPGIFLRRRYRVSIPFLRRRGAATRTARTRC